MSLQPHANPVRDVPGLRERKPGRRGEENTIVYTTSGNLTQEAEGVVAETPRLFNREWDQAVSSSNRCPRGDVAGELQGLGLLNRVARLIESLVLEHGGHVDGDNGGVNQEVLTLAMKVEPGHIDGAGAVRSESAKLGAALFATSQVSFAGTSLLTAAPDSLG